MQGPNQTVRLRSLVWAFIFRVTWDTIRFSMILIHSVLMFSNMTTFWIKKNVYFGIMPHCITELQRKRDRQTFELFFHSEINAITGAPTKSDSDKILCLHFLVKN